MPTTKTLDGNEAAAYVAYRCNEVIAIYPITPASPMGELSDAWAAAGQKNLFGAVPRVIEMQSEGGAAGAVHGAIQAGALTTTFTASQGLLLMLPNMYKIAGELSSAVIHIAARSLATHALSIFCDHGDAMIARGAGWAMLFANSVQEAHDFALISQAATLRARVPFLHIFDGFRTSHEVAKIEMLPDEVILSLVRPAEIAEHRRRALSPDRPVIRGTAQNPDVFFQSREAQNPFYAAVPAMVEAVMAELAEKTGRRYGLCEYVGHPEAERVAVSMGSSAETLEETVQFLVGRGEKVGLLKVRLFRPFPVAQFLAALPATTRGIVVLDRCKEPGAPGEPLYLDVLSALREQERIGSANVQGRAAFGGVVPGPKAVIGGRYGLGSKEFTPAMAKAALDELLQASPRNFFSVGIDDDVSQASLRYDPEFSTEDPETQRAIFFGLGSDGTVGANKNSIKIIGEETEGYAQGYFVYDSKKSGARTISHLRFGKKPIKSAYLIEKAEFVGVHQFGFLERFPVLDNAAPGAMLLINSPYGPSELWDKLPRPVQETVLAKRLRVFAIDAFKLAQEVGLKGRINTVMQTAHFILTKILPEDQAIEKIKNAIRASYGGRGSSVVSTNEALVDKTKDFLFELPVPTESTGSVPMAELLISGASDFLKNTTLPMIAGHGDALKVSAMPVDGTYPVGTAAVEKRNLALEVPVWEEDLCIQCGKCVMICPHSTIRAKRYDPTLLEHAPVTFKSQPSTWKEEGDLKFTIQVAVEDCTGCRLCVEICPVRDKSQVKRKALNMAPQRPLREAERENWNFFLNLPDTPVDAVATNRVKDLQLLRPYFEFSGACAGCGETPYIRLATQLFGDRMMVANATGCSSIYGGNLPTTPWTTDAHGRGPAWSNSLFEDNAEFGLGMRLALDKQRDYAKILLRELSQAVGESLTQEILSADQSEPLGVDAQRARVEKLREALAGLDHPRARDLSQIAESLVRRSVWIIGGDGWAYDIGYGGLDHVLATGENVKLLVLDTEVYSNTGGQASKATPRAAVAKFAAGGKGTPKKDLALLAMSYGYVYVAQIAVGANEAQTARALLEAESYDGPALVIANSPCIAHGTDMAETVGLQKLAVESGYWPIFRFQPRTHDKGPQLQLDCKAPKIPVAKYFEQQLRFRILERSDPETARRLAKEAQGDIDQRWQSYERMAKALSAVT